MGKESAAIPDYEGAATKTAAGNLEVARQTTQANRVNTFTPYGNLTYTNPGSKKADDWYSTELARAQAEREQDPEYQRMAANPEWKQANMKEFEQVIADKNPFKNERDEWTSTITLSPDQQKLLDQQSKSSLGLAALQDAGVERVAGMLGQNFDMSKIPERGTMGETYKGGGPAPLTYTPGSTPRLSSYYDPTKDTNTATEAILSRVNPQLDREEAALRTRLANQGITQGSEAYNTETELAGNRRNDAYTQAALQGIDLGLRQQGQTFGQSATGQQMGMAEQAQMFGQGITAQQLAQSQQAQQYSQQNANYANAERARQQAIQEEAYLRSLPLNELNALRSGAQVTNPTFGGAPAQANVGGADYTNALSGNFNAQVGNVNANNAASSQAAQAAAAVAASYAGSTAGAAALSAF